MSTNRFSDGMPIEYISDSATLNLLCRQWQKESFLAIDTEFERTNTFYARVGLLQIADRNSCHIIDPLLIDDWSGLSELLGNPQCTLVMHSCSEDLNLLQTFLGCVPASIFDTQLAAAFLGIGFSISYQALVENLLGIEVAKDETRSDWIKRPLSEKQILYAATDVRYLLQIRDLLNRQLQQRGITDWLRAECDQQLRSAQKIEDESLWESFYVGISNAWRLDAEGLQALQVLCYWREQKARERNKPRSWIVKDGDLMNLCNVIAIHLRNETLSLDVIFNAEGVDRRFLSRNGSEILTLLSAESNLQEVDPELLNKPLSAPLRKKLKLCQQIANEKADELEISPELLGRKKYLLELIRSFDRSGEIQWGGELSGWRRKILEPELTVIMNGTNSVTSQ